MTLNTEELRLWPGGQFYFEFQNIHGRSLTDEHVGDLLGINEYDSPDRTQLSQFWWQQTLWSDHVTFRIGKLDSNAHLANTLNGADFLHSVAVAIPNMPQPTYPDCAFGSELYIEPLPWLYLSGGIYDGEGIGDHSPFHTAFHGNNDSFTLVELGLMPEWSIAETTLPGLYRIGGWYHSGDWEIYFNDLQGRRRPRFHEGNSGWYLSLDQQITRENPDQADSIEGLGLFFMYGWAPSAYNEISQSYVGGWQYTGLLPTRDEDVFGMGIFHGQISEEIQRLEQRFDEMALECFYKCQLTPHLSVQPVVQYVIDPGGDGRDALVGSLMMTFNL
ncbi:MAG: Porin B [Phycisphaerae bacterium]|nr:Porin B [Phycisphaerae bacterium]